MEILITPAMLGERDNEGALIQAPQLDILGRPAKKPYLTTQTITGTRYFVVIPANAGEIELKYVAPKSAKAAKDETSQG